MLGRKSFLSSSRLYQPWRVKGSCVLSEMVPPFHCVLRKKENPNQVTLKVFSINKNSFGFLHVDDSER